MLEYFTLALALMLALALRPWRLLADGALLSPLLGALVILPWLWALPRLHAMPLQLQLSGACAVVLMLGWPLAVLTLCMVGLVGQFIAPTDWDVVVAQIFWAGVLPASLGLLGGLALRRWCWHHPFIYILGRGFATTVVCTFVAQVSANHWGSSPSPIGSQSLAIGYWLVAWGDGFMTGMLAAIFVAFRPEWLATWSDRIYLKK